MNLKEQLNEFNNTGNNKRFLDDYNKLFEHRTFACDFECTTQEPYIVYMVTIEDVNTGEQWCYETIDDFLMFCEEHPNSVIYFHNGDNYDFEFIINRCFARSDWRVNLNKNLSIIKKLNIFELTPTGKLRTSKGMYVQAEAKIMLRDTVNVLKGSIKGLGATIGLEKGLGDIETPLVAKINDDGTWIEQTKQYDFIEHSTNFKEDCIKRKWWDYAIQDTHILAEIIKAYDLLEYAKEKKYTIAGIAYNEMLKESEEYRMYLKSLNDKAKASKEFRKQAEVLNRVAKKAYKGGVAWSNQIYTTMEEEYRTNHGYHLDYTSMYPGIYTRPDLYPLPRREPTNKKTDLYIIHYKNLRATVKNNMFPLIKMRTDAQGVNSRFYLPRFVGDISLTKPENDYLMECYDNIQYDDCEVYYYEEHHMLEQAMKSHGDKWYAVKLDADIKGDDEAKRVHAKMMLNTCYGYLGFFEKNIPLYKYSLVDNVIRKEKSGESVTGLPFAEVPAAAFITAYGRVKLARDINAVGVDKVVCCDTDSLFTVDIPLEELEKVINIDGQLGNFKIEHTFTKIRTLKPKTWCISNDDGIPIAQATAGSNYKFKHIKNFNHGEKIYSTVKVRGVGGVGIRLQEKVLGSDNSIDYVNDNDLVDLTM